MKQYLAYLSYVLRHKWFVMLACFENRLYWRGLIHDLSKFLPSEFIPYARHFYAPDGSKQSRRDKTGYYKPTDTGDPAFDHAWFLHQKRNSHHWQYWTIPEDGEGLKLLPMPHNDVLEMICDWQGAGRAQGTKQWRDITPWYRANAHKLQLHNTTVTYLALILATKGIIL